MRNSPLEVRATRRRVAQERDLNQPHNAVMAVLTELSHASVTAGIAQRPSKDS